MGKINRRIRYGVGGVLCLCGLALISGLMTPRGAATEPFRLPFGVVVCLYGLLRIALTWTNGRQEGNS
jgi:hypothetical protein